MNSKRLARTALLLAWVCVSALAAGTANTDHAVLAAARTQQPAVVQSLSDMVMIESGSDDAAGLQKMAAYCEGRLKALGATTRIVPAAHGKPPGLVEGVFRGNGKLRVMLIAHMDTVYREGILETEPYRHDGNKLYGPGIADDKGGIATILGSLAVLQKIGWNDYGQLTVLFNPDEEVGSEGTGAIIAKFAADNDVVLSYEPNASKETARVLAGVAAEGVLLSAAGTARVRMQVAGRAAHAGAAPEEGRNALVELADQIVRTRDAYKSVKGAQMNWTMASASPVRNQIPGHAEALADVRYTEPDAPTELEAALQKAVAGHSLVPDTTTTVRVKTMRPIYKADARTMALAKLAQSVYAELHGGDLAEAATRAMPGGGMAFDPRNLILIPRTMGGTDAGFAQSSGKAAVLEGLGLAGWGYHARNEYIEIDSIVPRLYLTSRMLIELGKRADTGRSF
jgi:glutamate carboxypeptidase